MKLYFVSMVQPEGNMDLLVEAPNIVHALYLWGSYYYPDNWDRNNMPELTGLTGELIKVDPHNSLATDDDLRIFEITLTGTCFAHTWHTDTPVVAYMEKYNDT